MAHANSTSARRLQQLSDTIGFELDEESAREFAESIESIHESIDPVMRRDPLTDTPEVTADSRPDPNNAFISQCRITRPGASEGSLTGVEVALKDNIAVAGVELTAGSAVLAGCVPSRNAPVTDALLDAGATIVGKTNMDEFAFGPTGETSAFGPARNPRHPSYTPGGSSSGSGAAVADDAADLALGTDTGGSVRIPASFCGVYGLKPTQGRIPIEGVVELARSFDTIGVLARDLELVERGYGVMSGDDDRSDGTDLASLTIGVPDELLDSSSEVTAVVESAVDRLVDAGATVQRISIPSPDLTSAIWRAISMTELYVYVATAGRPYRIVDGSPPVASDQLAAMLETNLERFSDPLQQYLLVGALIVHEDRGRRYVNARVRRNEVAQTVSERFEGIDAMICPTTPTTAFEFGSFSRASSPRINENTHLFNLTGDPAISIPHGEVDGLPVGLQLAAARGEDRRLLSIARAVEDTLAGDDPPTDA